jgi:hypothetical protein
MHFLPFAALASLQLILLRAFLPPSLSPPSLHLNQNHPYHHLMHTAHHLLLDLPLPPFLLFRRLRYLLALRAPPTSKA